MWDWEIVAEGISARADLVVETAETADHVTHAEIFEAAYPIGRLALQYSWFDSFGNGTRRTMDTNSVNRWCGW